MAITQNPLIGSTSGKFGGAIFLRSFGKNIIRSNPVTVRDANTTAQQSQRSKFKVAQDWVVMFLSIIRAGFAGLNSSMSVYAFALGWYMKNAVHWVSDHWEIDYSSAKFTFGELEVSPDIIIDTIWADYHLTVQWSAIQSPSNSSDTDVIHVIVYNQSQNNYQLFTKSRGSLDIDDDSQSNPRIAGDIIHVYCYFVSQNNSLYSNTLYLGQFTTQAP